MNVEPSRHVLEGSLADIRAARATLDAAEARILAALDLATDLVPLKRAAHAMGIEEEAARKRAQRGAGVMLDGRWHLPRPYVEAATIRKMSR